MIHVTLSSATVLKQASDKIRTVNGIITFVVEISVSNYKSEHIMYWTRLCLTDVFKLRIKLYSTYLVKYYY